MTLRTRKLFGSIVLVIWMIVFSLTAMALIGKLPERPHFLLELIMYVVLGFGWILPLKPVFIWMGKGK